MEKDMNLGETDYSQDGTKEKEITFSEYSKLAMSTKIYSDKFAVTYPMLSLQEELGEASQILSKAYRDKDGVLDDSDLQRLYKEIGDILWQLNALATDLGFSLNNIANSNIEKLKQRKNTNTLSGSGESVNDRLNS